MSNELERLITKFPLPSEWTQPELFTDRLCFDDKSLNLVGLSASHDSGFLITGSAAELGTDPLARAYFELLERVSTWEAEAKRESSYVLTDISGERTQEFPGDVVFPVSPNPERWRYARSNGVAAHPERAVACQSAAFELVERDRVLRSWYGESAPIPQPGFSFPLPEALLEVCTFEAYLFPSNDGEPWVSGVFAFPKKDGVPRTHGFAARGDRADATEAALRECLQALGFLWGEPIPTSPPVFAPSPDFHQDRFLLPQSESLIRDWLSGKHLRYGSPRRVKQDIPWFVALTPKAVQGKLVIVKAVQPERFPLFFGERLDGVPPQFPEELLIHPFA